MMILSHPSTKSHRFPLLISCLGAGIGMAIITYLAELQHTPLLIPSFGASAIILYGSPNSPLARPRNIIGSHFFAALMGICCYQLFGNHWYSITLAVVLSLMLMELTDTLHPPGGATAIVAIASQGDFSFLLFPILAGACLMVAVATLFHRLVAFLAAKQAILESTPQEQIQPEVASTQR